MKAGILIACSFSSMLSISCVRGGNSEKVILPPTPVLSIRSTWAVVKSPLLRIREQPSIKSTPLFYIGMGSIAEVLSKSDRRETIENEVSYWYRIDYEGLKGWVFGSYLEMFDSRSKAESYAKTMNARSTAAGLK